MIRQPGCLRYLRDHRGVSIIALIIIMAVLGSLGYVFSALIATKQYSTGMGAPSQQAFYIANSGIEYGIRYASERGWTKKKDLNGLDNMTVNLGQGQFTLDYDQPADTLFSVGQVSASQREAALENFTSFVSNIQCLELVTSIDPPPISGIPPCTYNQGSNTYVRFYIRNICSSQPPLTRFRATWKPSEKEQRLVSIKFDLVPKFVGSCKNKKWTDFTNQSDVSTCQDVQVLVRFNNVLAGNTTFVFLFRDTNGAVYTFSLGDPPNC